VRGSTPWTVSHPAAVMDDGRAIATSRPCQEAHGE